VVQAERILTANRLSKPNRLRALYSIHGVMVIRDRTENGKLVFRACGELSQLSKSAPYRSTEDWLMRVNGSIHQIMAPDRLKSHVY